VGWSSQAVVAERFIGTDFEIDPSGIFFYNGNPGPGNPPVFSATVPGVTEDPYGNAVQPDFTSYGSGGMVTQLANSVLNIGIPFSSPTNNEPASVYSPDGYSLAVSSGVKNGNDTAASLVFQSADVAGAAYPDGAIFASCPIILGTWETISAWSGGNVLTGLAR
jgi:hypothetical protein